MSALKKFSRSIWFFPVLLLVPLVFLTIFKISGSSVGMYHEILYGAEQKDPDLLYGRPRGIRSDEWLVNTQLTIAQKNNNYQRINTNIGYGEDVSLSGDTPYKEWSIAFKPQALAFFVMPFENAFSFRWWAMGYLLIVSCYLFVLALLPGKRFLAALIGLALFASPFVQWWYLYGTLGSLYFALFIAVVLVKLLKAAKTKTKILWSLLLSYLLICFALVLYPPYQIPCALAIAVFFTGYLLENIKRQNKKDILKTLGLILAACIVAGLTVLAFVKTRSTAINLISNTVYPGKRESVSGGLNTLHIFGNHLSPLLQSDRRGPSYYVNQSEASGFIFVFPFLFLLSFYFLLKTRLKVNKIDWPLFTVNLALLVSLARVFLPLFSPVYKIFFLHLVPPERMMIGVGLLAFMQLVLLIRHYSKFKPPISFVVVVLSTVAAFITFYYFGLYVKTNYPIFLDRYDWLLVSALIMSAIVSLICLYKFRIALVLLLAFSIFSVYKINPLYRGMGFLLHSEVISDIARVDKNQRGEWVVADLLISENFPATQGAKAYSGVHIYPQLALWQESDPSRQKEFIYNRYAHIGYVVSEVGGVEFNLAQLDSVQITLNPCSDSPLAKKIDYILAAGPKNNQCLKLLDTALYPKLHFYIYEVER